MNLLGATSPPPLLVAAVAGLVIVSVTSAIGFEPPRTDVAIDTATTSTTRAVPADSPEVTFPGTIVPIPTSGPDEKPATTTTPPPPPRTTTQAGTGPVAPGAAQRPAGGFHRYIVALDDDEDITKIEVRHGPGDRLDVTDHDLGQTDHTVWNGAGQVVQSTDTEGSGTCDWQPDVTVLKFPMAVGTQWAADSRCKIADEDGATDVHLVARWRVMKAERAEVDHVPVDVWVIDTQTTLSFSGVYEGEAYSARQDEKATLRFAPKHGLVTTVDATRTYISQQGSPDEQSYDEREHRELMSLTPRQS